MGAVKNIQKKLKTFSIRNMRLLRPHEPPHRLW